MVQPRCTALTHMKRQAESVVVCLQVVDLHAKVLATPKLANTAAALTQMNISYEVQWQAVLVCMPARKIRISHKSGAPHCCAK